jgi:hypothetical protein
MQTKAFKQAIRVISNFVQKIISWRPDTFAPAAVVMARTDGARKRRFVNESPGQGMPGRHFYSSLAFFLAVVRDSERFQ